MTSYRRVKEKKEKLKQRQIIVYIIGLVTRYGPQSVVCDSPPDFFISQRATWLNVSAHDRRIELGNLVLCRRLFEKEVFLICWKESSSPRGGCV